MARVASGWAPVAVVGLSLGWAALFGGLSIFRFLAGGAHAEDLGFTDQVVWNFLRGQWFRTSVYAGATWNTEIDVSRLARPDSLLAFHVEPLLLLFVPLYALGAGPIALLIAQAASIGGGALPAFRLAQARSGSALTGLAVAVSYLLSPFGQSAVLADVHTVTFAAPLLILMIERLVVARALRQAIAAGVLASLAREDVGVVVALLGALLSLNRSHRHTGVVLVAAGLACTTASVLIIRAYSGGDGLPFATRYGPALANGTTSLLNAVGRQPVVEYLQTVLLSGAWLAVLSPLALLPAAPALALNALSASPWMMSGKAHYSALVLPIVTLATVAGLVRLRGHPRVLRLASVGLVGCAVLSYVRAGSGPLAADSVSPRPAEHARAAATLAARIPPDAAVSASSSLVPWLSHRSRVFVFPAVNDADLVFLDLRSTPGPTSAGDLYLRVRSMLSSGGWAVEQAQDGLLLLGRDDGAPPTAIADVADGLRQHDAGAAATPVPLASYVDGCVSLLHAELTPSTDGSLDPDGPHGQLNTTWQADAPLPPGTRLSVDITLKDGRLLHVWDAADLWWNPPDGWPIGKPTRIEIPNVPLREFRSWQATFAPPDR